MTTQVVSQKKDKWTDKIRHNANSKYWFRLTGEFLSSFFFIFVINLLVALGEDDIPVFNFIYKFNIGMGLWIGFMTLMAFVWAQKTTLSANIINLALSHRRQEITNGTFWTSVPVQFIGGVLGALSVYFIAGYLIHGGSDGIHAMGGAFPKLKGLTSTNTAGGTFVNPWATINFVDRWMEGTMTKGYVYLYAVIQGFINASWIVIAFVLNSITDDKTNNRTQQLILRYIILVVGITITTMFTANTTNWVRLFTPTVVNVIAKPGKDTLLVMDTTMVYIAVQMVGLVIVYFELLWKDIVAEKIREEKKQELKKKEIN